MTEGGATRHHALDAMRAAMMLLGLVLHSAASYTPTPLRENWPYQDASTSQSLELLIFFIHIFRMPAFFAMAGFFAALLYRRDGPGGFAVNRARRVLLPLFLFWVVLAPLVGGGFLFAAVRGTNVAPLDVIGTGTLRAEPNLMHLWFLWFLVLFYAAALAVLRVTRDRALRPDICAALTTSWWSPLGWTALTTLSLLPMSQPAIVGSPSLLPPLRTLIAYGIFFIYGWLLFSARGHLDSIARGSGLRTGLGVLAAGGYLFVVITEPVPDPDVAHAVACALMALSTWTFLLGLTGLFLRYAHRKRRATRYLADAAYWMYLVHLPIVIWTAGVLARSSLPALVKFSIVLAVTSAICLGTYHRFVRFTRVGTLLNGTRRSNDDRPRWAG